MPKELKNKLEDTQDLDLMGELVEIMQREIPDITHEGTIITQGVPAKINPVKRLFNRLRAPARKFPKILSRKN